MDIPLQYFDEYVGDRLYSALDNPFSRYASSTAATSATKLSFDTSSPSSLLSSIASYLGTLPSLSSLGRDSIVRQSISLYAITYVGILLLYFSVATLSYYLIFDHRMKLHPRYLKDQVRKEIMYSLDAFPVLDLLTLPWFVGDVRGWSMLYDTVEEGPFGKQGGVLPWVYMAGSAAFFLWFTDFAIYWVHRWLHIPFLYKRLHKPHHKWIIPTPFASHAFHPVDGYLQSVPYHMACYMFPIHKYLFIGLFSFVNFWSIFIHDSDMLCGHPLEHYINGPAHHTLHHIYFTCNYGQYFTWADKYFSSFRIPAKGDDPLLAVLAQIERKKILDAVEAAEKKEGLKLVNEEGEKISERDVVTELVQVVPELSEEEEEEVESEAPTMERSQSASDSGIGSEPDSAGEEEKKKKEKKSTIKAASVTAPPRPPRREGLRSRK
ncbi:C-5 sterol desaturase [Sporobolomyces salmoneus]|uniref:C-5 sterol desaturase n=1 Tax=Sporobolomyces salmoneus TaxID=183962 RepID=UPI003170F050